jgi:hypothetical protein
MATHFASGDNTFEAMLAAYVARVPGANATHCFESFEAALVGLGMQQPMHSARQPMVFGSPPVSQHERAASRRASKIARTEHD